MKGLLLAGGHGTRLRPLTSTGNKHMIPIANQPILFYGLRQLARAGVSEVGIVLGPIHEGIREAVGDGAAFGLEVTYINQGQPKGLAHAVLCARSFLAEEPFVMYLGDNLLEHGLESFLQLFESERADAVIGVTTVADPHQYGIVEFSGKKIVSIEEKPRNPKGNQALVGVYVFSPKVHDVIARLAPSARGELEITDAIRALVERGDRVVVQRVHGWWKDTGAPEDLLHANDLVLDSRPGAEFEVLGTVESGATLKGPVALGEDSVIESGASVHGPVVIGRDVRVGSRTEIGPRTSIGDGVQLNGCAIRRSIVLEGARISGPVRLRDSLIGRYVDLRAVAPVPEEIELLVGDACRLRL
jgi:glucose-1-phosphate thymidylyltransferase